MAENVKEPINLGSVLFSPSGRIGRGPFWAGWAISFAAGLILGWIPIIGLLVALVNIYVAICVYGKRLHDMGKTAWIYGGYLIASLIAVIVAFAMFLGPIMADPTAFETMTEEEAAMMMLTSGGPALIIFALTALIGIAIWLWCGIAPGQRGDNQYGPDPRTYS